MKWATGNVIAATLFERNKTIDNIDNVEFLLDFVNLIIHRLIIARLSLLPLLYKKDGLDWQ